MIALICTKMAVIKNNIIYNKLKKVYIVRQDTKELKIFKL